VLVNLGKNLIGQNPPVRVDHGGGGFVATGFDAQNDHLLKNLFTQKPSDFTL
jgi:hypothetical protein